jgi:hypothetical protein
MSATILQKYVISLLAHLASFQNTLFMHHKHIAFAVNVKAS